MSINVLVTVLILGLSVTAFASGEYRSSTSFPMHRSSSSAGISFYQPRFAANASWSRNGTTIATNATVGSRPFKIFIDRNNTLYISSPRLNKTLVLSAKNFTLTRTIGSRLSGPQGIFVASDSTVYVDNGQTKRRVEKWTPNATSGIAVMNVTGSCFSLFIDANNMLYCSLDRIPMVVRSSLAAGINVPFIVAAGNRSNGSSSYLLDRPNGIFVDNQFRLYVADCNNNRVQRFLPSQRNGVTVAGAAASGTITLNCPTDIILDGDNYLFITDYRGNRIVRQGPTGFRCIVGCSGGIAAEPFHLSSPRSMAFDSQGNLFVADTGNGRIQKFLLIANASGQ